MKKQKNLRKILILMIIFLLTLFVSNTVFASDFTKYIGEIEYSQEYLDWLELDDDIKKDSLMPRMYNVYKYTQTPTNPLKAARLLGGTLENKFSLQQYIKDNLVIKNQKNLGACWTFATLGSLETNLALQDYYSNNPLKIYDFSERHMEYATSRIFADNAVNEKGFNRKVGVGGTPLIALAYLTNGTGAIKEEEMPYTDSSYLIDISEIQNKTVSSQIYDSIDFPSNSTADVEEIKTMMKNYIKNYGAISSRTHENTGCLNSETGALYCPNSSTHPVNHAVLIVGWDDNYSITNFNEDSKPTNPGAWIVRDSHGTDEENTYTIEEIKEILFESQKEYFESMGITSATEITDEYVNNFIESIGYTFENGKVLIRHNDDGYLYISYEDANIYSGLMGISKSADSIDYENIYQYDEYGSFYTVPLTSNKIYLANIFKKQTNSTEYLTQVAIKTPETVTCKVYVNPNGTSKSKNDLQLVQLKAGETETFDAGYHTLEFLNPVEITGDNFVVVIEIHGKRTNSLDISIECNFPDFYKKVTGNDIPSNNGLSAYSYVSIESGKCFFTVPDEFNNNLWVDLSTLYSVSSGNFPDSDSTIKAFTVSKISDNSLKNIEITTPPVKTTYFEGENFDKTGMVVKANYNDGRSLEITDYDISNATNLQVGQTSVTISYDGKTTTQAITVEENSVTKLEITTPPTKTTYKEGNSFDKTGMVVTATLKDGTTKEITDYEIIDGTNLKSGQTTVTISYKNKTVTQDITVEPNPLEKIEISTPPTKTKYVVGQNFDKTGMVVTATYQDNSEVEIIDYTIENGTNLTKEQTSVTINFENKTVEQAITVEEKQITSISINQKPSKTQYIQYKEDLDLTGGSIKVNYNDNSNEIIGLTSEQITVTGFDNEKLGTNTITITYQSKTTTFDVEIIEEAKPVNSNFDSSNCDVTNVKYYAFSDLNEEEYMTIDITINGIFKNTVNDSYKYYYYLSSNQEENNIENWIEITEEQKSSDKLEFKINTKDIKNLAELMDSNSLYLYIKEVAIKGGNQSVLITNSMELETDATVEIYLDNAKIEHSNSNNSTNSSSKDNTIATGILPNAGIRSVLIAIFIITICGIVIYIRYKNLSKYVK